MERIEAIHKASVSRPFAAAVVVMAAYDLSGAKAADLGKWLTSHWVVVLGNARYLLEAFDFLYLCRYFRGFGVFVAALTAVEMIVSARREHVFSWWFFLSSIALLLIWPFHPMDYVAPGD